MTKKLVAPMYDVAVIGGGPAGMMAAGRAAERGRSVLLLEKNPRLGKKLLITGGGRCNLTNAEFNTRALLAKFKDSDKFLFSAFAQWNVQDTLDFFHRHGLLTKTEAEGRVFPVTDSAQSVFDVLHRYLQAGNVSIATNTVVTRLIASDDHITQITCKDQPPVTARAVILATGGRSRPETGSTGDGFAWLRSLGHTVIESDPSLVPITLSDSWVSRVAGLTLPAVRISLWQNGVRQRAQLGKILFTHVGVSGPTVLNMSKDIRDLLSYGGVTITLDLFPTLDEGALDRLLLARFSEHQNKLFRNSLAGIVPSSLAPILVELSSINPDTQVNSLTKEARRGLGALLKKLPLTVSGLLGVEKAIVTSGGIALPEVNFKTMASRKIKNLYLVGDILNIDRPSGGYSLQLCWTTGFVAGTAVTAN